MKKMMMWSAAIVVVFAVGFAFAGYAAAAGVSSGRDMLFNGVTVFDQVALQACGSAAGGKAPEEGPSLIQPNGFTYFNKGLQGSRANGSCAGASSGAVSAWPGNGITAF